MVEASFQISLHKKDKTLLELIKNYFNGVGTINKQGKDIIQYRVSSLKILTSVIIPHFDKFPLITQKKADFILFQKVVNLMNCKEHLTIEGIEKIVAIAASLNLGLSVGLKAAFPSIVAIDRPLVQNQKIQSANWLAGFASVHFLRYCFYLHKTKTK